MVTYELSKTSGDVAEGGSVNDSYKTTYNDTDGGGGEGDSSRVKVNLIKIVSNTSYTIYKHQPPKNTGQPSLKFNGDDISPGKYQPTEKLTSIDVYFLNYNKGPCAQNKGEMEEPGGEGVQGKCEKDDKKGEGPGGMCAPVGKDKQETEQDKLPFIIVFNESENGPGSGPGSGETKKIYFGYPSESDRSPGSADWDKWQEFKAGTYITDAVQRLQMKLKQIDRALNKLDCIDKVRSTALNIMIAEDGDRKVKFKSGIDNDYTVGYKQSIDDRYYKHTFATWRDGGSNLGSNCLLEVDGSGESKCYEPIDDDGSMKSKIDQYYIDQVKAMEYKLITAYFDTKGSKTSQSTTSQKDNLLLVEFTKSDGSITYLRRRDVNGNWWSLREAKYVSGQKGLSAGNLIERLNDISTGTEDKKVTAFILDNKVQYKGVPEFKDDKTSNTAYNKYRHDLKGADPGVRTVLLFGGEVIHINTLKPSRVRPHNVEVYYLKSKCGRDNEGGADDKHPFLVVFERTGSGGRSIKRIYHLNKPSESKGSTGLNDWSKWVKFKNIKKEGINQDITTRLHEKLRQIESECDSLGHDQQAKRRRVYDILTHVDRDKGEQEEDLVVGAEEDDDDSSAGDDGSTVQEETEYEVEEQDYVNVVSGSGPSVDGKEKKQYEDDESESSSCAEVEPAVSVEAGSRAPPELADSPGPEGGSGATGPGSPPLSFRGGDTGYSSFYRHEYSGFSSRGPELMQRETTKPSAGDPAIQNGAGVSQGEDSAGTKGGTGVQNNEFSGGLGPGKPETSLGPPGSGDDVRVSRVVGARGSAPVTLSQELKTSMQSDSPESISHSTAVQHNAAATDSREDEHSTGEKKKEDEPEEENSNTEADVVPNSVSQDDAGAAATLGSEASSLIKKDPGVSGVEDSPAVPQSKVQETTIPSESTKSSTPVPDGQDSVSAGGGQGNTGASGSSVTKGGPGDIGSPDAVYSLGVGVSSYSSSAGSTLYGGRRRTTRAATGGPVDVTVSNGNEGVSPGSNGQTPIESHTPVIIGSAAGGTVGVAALSGGGYLWHRLGTRTIRDMMVYF